MTSTQCYNVKGEVNPTLRRCNNDGLSGHSACCDTDKEFPDICLDNGLCLGTGHTYMGAIFKAGCTDIDGAASECSKACKNEFPSGTGTVETVEILYCQSETWCCRALGNTTNCCDDTDTSVSSGYIGNITSPALEAIRRISNETNTGSAADNDTTCSIAGSNTSNGTSSNDGSTAATVGGVLGGLLFASLVGLATALWLWRRERRGRRELLQQRLVAGEGSVRGAKGIPEHYLPVPGPVEVDTTREVLELPGRG